MSATDLRPCSLSRLSPETFTILTVRKPLRDMHEHLRCVYRDSGRDRARTPGASTAVSGSVRDCAAATMLSHVRAATTLSASVSNNQVPTGLVQFTSEYRATLPNRLSPSNGSIIASEKIG